MEFHPELRQPGRVPANTGGGTWLVEVYEGLPDIERALGHLRAEENERRGTGGLYLQQGSAAEEARLPHR